MIMLIVTLINIFLTSSTSFPIIFWVPWILYMVVYLIIDFSFLGLQLTLQYTLPVLIGIVASGLTYTEKDLQWIFEWFIRLIAWIYLTFAVSNIFGSGYPPGMAAMPMIFSIAISLFMGLFFLTRKKKYLIYVGLLFLAPIVDLTRMGIAAISGIIIFHFANRRLKTKLIFGILGVAAFWIVFNTRAFQEATFYRGEGTLSDVTMNYYDNPKINSSGRTTWKRVLEPGLKAEPVWGNGPRADNAYLIKITRTRAGEAHNDYLSVRFNYGYVGLSLLLFGFAATFISLFRLSRKHNDSYFIWLISTSVLTLFIAFLMFMYTDNILKYTIYFPNYFFSMIGIVYSLKRDEDISSYSALQ